MFLGVDENPQPPHVREGTVGTYYLCGRKTSKSTRKGASAAVTFDTHRSLPIVRGPFRSADYHMIRLHLRYNPDLALEGNLNTHSPSIKHSQELGGTWRSTQTSGIKVDNDADVFGQPIEA
ncbi:hypothetical protein J6590_063739 [Homalodisca vitripennis]|nr:hypothetical protein J6590_063739 [Homalodisca vitripennis]